MRRDISLACELYDPEAVPGPEGFDPLNAIDCFADFGWEFRGRQYRRLVKKWSDVSRSAGPKFNSHSVTFDNARSTGRYMAKLALERPENNLENCQLVVRLVSRSQSYELEDTYPVFVGKCEKAIEVDGETFQLSAKQHAGSVDTELPPRRYAADDPERPEDSILSEAFRYLPTSFSVTYSEKVQRSTIASLFGFKTKTVQRTAQFSTHSYLDSAEVVAVPLGRVQLLGKPVASKDLGGAINALYSFGDGLSYGIESVANVRNNTQGLSQPTANFITYGHRAKEGEGDRKQRRTGATFMGGDAFPGDAYYSRTARLACSVTGSSVSQDDPASDISAVVLGCRVPLPDASGSYSWAAGSISSGSTSLSVSHANYRNGDWLFIEGAGETVTDADGDHRVALVAKVVSGGGASTLTLEHAAHNSVTGARVRKVGWTDNPVHLTRFVYTDPHLMGLPEELMDDAVNYRESLYDDEFLEDESHADTVMLPDSELGRVGTLYRRFTSTSAVNPRFWRALLGEGGDSPYLRELVLDPDGNFFDPLDPTTQGTPAVVKTYRRRYTANVPLSETQKAVDFLNDVLFPAARLYTSQGPAGKIQIRHKRPVDTTLLRGAAAPGDTEIPVQSVFEWREDLSGQVFVGRSESVTSEIRRVTGWRYSTAGNSVTLAASGGVTASGATFSGGDGASTPATAEITVTSLSGTKTVTIDGVAVSYAPQTDDTVDTIGAWLATAINANPTLRDYVRAEWSPADSTTVSLTAKVGFLQLESQLEYDHAEAEEVLRIAMSFSGRADAQANLSRANVLENTFKWPLGSRQSSVNQVVLKYRSAADDWKLTELRVPRRSEIKGTVNPKEVSGSAIDNHHQAVRVANGHLAELRDCDFFASLASDGEALTLTEGQVVAASDVSGGFVNLLIRTEDVNLTPDLKASFTGRRYLSSMYTDDAPARSVPLPTTLAVADSPPATPTGLTLSEHSVTATSSTLHGEFLFGYYRGGQVGRILLKRDGETVFSDAGIVLPDADLNGVFDLPGIPPGTHEVKIRPEAGALVGTATAATSITTTTNGTLEVSTLEVGGEQVIGPRQPAVTHVTAGTGSAVSGSAAATYDAATQTLIDDLKTQVNTLTTAVTALKTTQNTALSRMETHGLIDT